MHVENYQGSRCETALAFQSIYNKNAFMLRLLFSTQYLVVILSYPKNILKKTVEERDEER